MRGLVLALLALLLIAGDSGRYVPQLLHNEKVLSENDAENDDAMRYVLLWSAAMQGSSVAQQRLVTLAGANNSIYWLEKLVAVNNADAAWALYQSLGNKTTSEQYVRLAAMGNVPQAQLAFAMSTNHPEKREQWLLRAAKQDYAPAQAALADWYLLQNRHDDARVWLEKTAHNDMQSAFNYGRMLWDDNNRDDALFYLQLAADKGHKQAAHIVSVIQRYVPLNPNQVSAYDWSAHDSCFQRIQPFATSLSTIAQAHSLYVEYTKDARLNTLPLCIAPPVWLENNTLNCDNDNKGRLNCDIKSLASVVTTRNLTHAIVVGQQGKANVQNGVMYLDISDTYSVMVHELAHFSGFIDEYPLNKSIASRYCNESAISVFSPPNLVVDSAVSYHPFSTVELWQKTAKTLDSTYTIDTAKTCDALGVRAYKPSDVVTFMEHHDSGVIPPLYLALWRQQLANPDIQRPISMNLFQAFHKQGKTSQAGHWLAAYENRQHLGD